MLSVQTLYPATWIIFKYMLITILEVAALLAIIIIPLKGPAAKEKKKVFKIDRDVTNANYAINEDGYLEEIRGRELSNHTH